MQRRKIILTRFFKETNKIILYTPSALTMGWRFKNTSPVTESAFVAILARNFRHFSMTLIIMKNENPPNAYRCEGKLILEQMERQQGKNDKTPLDGQCSLEEWWSHKSQDGRLLSKQLGIVVQAQQSVVEQYVIGCGGTPNLKEGRRG
jgi:hypothetical protein